MISSTADTIDLFDCALLNTTCQCSCITSLFNCVRLIVISYDFNFEKSKWKTAVIILEHYKGLLERNGDIFLLLLFYDPCTKKEYFNNLWGYIFSFC